MVERGIYDLSTWVAGMRFLPPPVEVPACFKALGFTELPAGIKDVRERYRTLARTAHPDAGGSPEGFAKLKAAADQAVAMMNERRSN